MSGHVDGTTAATEPDFHQEATINSMPASSTGIRLNIRAVPWIAALVGLAIPLVGGGLVGWPFVVAWLVILSLVWVVGRQARPRERGVRIALAVAALPILFLLAWEGGWWLIPADVAWLVIEVASPGD